MILLTMRLGEPDATGEAGEGAVQDPLTWPLELGQTLIVYHPHAQRPPEVVPTRELSTFTRNPDALEDYVDDTRPPYFPFETLADFEQTELFIKRNCADPFINEELDLWTRHGPTSDVTLKNAREMHQHLLAAGKEDDLSQVMIQSYIHSMSSLADYLKFTQVEIQAEYEHGQTTEMRKYTVRFRPVLDAVKQVLEDPALRKSLIRYPERHYIRKPGTNVNMRVWSDVHTADDWWELQVNPLLE